MRVPVAALLVSWLPLKSAGLRLGFAHFAPFAVNRINQSQISRQFIGYLLSSLSAFISSALSR